jgi:hypothetical protein
MATALRRTVFGALPPVLPLALELPLAPALPPPPLALPLPLPPTPLMYTMRCCSG